MHHRTADFAVYPALFAASSAYAAILDRHKQRIEPDGTWIEVTAGTALCLIAAAIRARLGPDTRQSYERSVWLAFLVGGTPVIIWQLARAYLRQKRRADTLQHYATDKRKEDDTTTGTASPLARFRWPSPPANGRCG